MAKWEAKWMDLMVQASELDDEFKNAVIEHVADNAYVNDLKLETLKTNLHAFMVENVDGTADNLVSMFGLHQLNLEEDTTRDVTWSLPVD